MKIKLDGVEVDAEAARKALAEYYEQKDKKEEMFHRYTMEQWKRIIDGKYLCSYGDDESELTDGTLSHLRAVDIGAIYPFKIIGGWKYCRPAQRYGVLIPHFGGDKPEWLKDDDLIVWRNYDDGSGCAASISVSSEHWGCVTAFIAMPAS